LDTGFGEYVCGGVAQPKARHTKAADTKNSLFFIPKIL
jgi:hypothetical protein